MLTFYIKGVACPAMESVAAIIEAFGGTTAFGRAIGVNLSTASEMKRRASIPVRHWQRVLDAASKHGIPLTIEKLMSVHADRPKEAETEIYPAPSAP